MRIIAISGRKRSGKDSIANALTQNIPDCHRIALADAVKDFVALATGIPREAFEDAYKGRTLVELTYSLAVPARWSIQQTPRDLLQAFGVAARDQFGPNFWVDQLYKRVNNLGLFRPGSIIVVPDVRFWNELQELGGFNREDGRLVSPQAKLVPRQDRDGLHRVIRTNRIDRLEKHEFVKCHSGGTVGVKADRCAWQQVTWCGPTDIKYCNLPTSAHPSHYSGDTHESETTLPDEGPFYDLTLVSGDIEETKAKALEYVQAWIAKEKKQ